MRILFTLPVVLLAVALPSLAQAQSSSCSPYDSDAHAQAQAMTVKASSPKQPVHFHWVAGENDITFTAGANGQVHAEGMAAYTSETTTNTGEFSGDTKPGGEELRFGNPQAEDECLVTVERRGPYLLVSDNLRCGGVNVSFRGLYVRVKTK
jgi:hypothetical protein